MTVSPTSDEIAPRHFCGSTDVACYYAEFGGRMRGQQVFCNTCHARGPQAKGSNFLFDAAEAIRRWNEREEVRR